MRTILLSTDENSIRQAARAIQNDDLVAFPTETVYGLGANALSEQAVRKIFIAKERPVDNPLIVHIASKEEASSFCIWTPRAQILANAFWPGPLTLLLPKKELVPAITTAGLSTVAVRMPDHPIARALISKAECPIAAPSANRSGRPSPTQAQHVLEDMQGRIPYVLDGGPCKVGVESTVLDLSGENPVILRPGAVTAEQIAMIIGICEISPSVMRPCSPNEAAPSPGMKHKHYAPRAKMTLFTGQPLQRAQAICARYDATENACILAFEQHLPLYQGRFVKSMGKDAAQAAHRLFYLLREMDALGIQRIFAETLPEDGIGLAVMNRMSRAASFDICDTDQEKLEGIL